MDGKIKKIRQMKFLGIHNYLAKMIKIKFDSSSKGTVGKFCPKA